MMLLTAPGSELPLSCETSPAIVVIIPAFGHPVLLAEALQSVMLQKAPFEIAVVIVNDGCRLEETGLISQAYASTHPNVVYLLKRNGGPSSARNLGIDYALARWPDLEAIFFLDADNRLAPTALTDAFQCLQDNPDAGWVYTNIDSFGIKWSANYAIPYSPLLHIVYDNLCDTGSLIRRAVLEAGARFDEDSLSGYEDWDFWLQCIGLGFNGHYAAFGFSYRQRPESRYREMNRMRGAVTERLRRRHWAIAAPRNLVRLEHETNPRFLFVPHGGAGNRAFTDPSLPGQAISDDMMLQAFCGANVHPDEVLLWPYFVFGSEQALALLGSLRILNCIFSLLERALDSSPLVAVTIENAPDKIAIDITSDSEMRAVHRRAMLWGTRAGTIRDEVSHASLIWLRDLDRSRMQITEICIQAPLAASAFPAAAATAAVVGTIQNLMASPAQDTVQARWNWRPKHFPDRNTYYQHMCRYVGVSALPARLASAQLEVGVVLPIAAFGGAEKVAYAMAQYLRRLGARVHLFVLGKPEMKIINEYGDAFDTLNFLADPDFPIWGGRLQVWGQECFSPDAPEIKLPEISGLLANLDLVVNCHSQPLNSVMGTLRSQYKMKTATYLHVFDTSPMQRPVGHPYLALAFEHAYDIMFTCSRQLASQMHGLGVPQEKLVPIRNAAGFTIPEEQFARQRQLRAAPRGARPLRILYIGRLDPQKGVERLVYAAGEFAARGMAVEFRVVGAGLMEEGDRWGPALQRFGVTILPPVYDNAALAEAYAWADVLLLPSRWEGAPLVIAECHLLGCIPVATNVGAVDELLTDGVDGFLAKSEDDALTAVHMVDAVEAIMRDDSLRTRMSLAGLQRAAENKWETNFAPLGAWVDAAFPGRLGGLAESSTVS